MMNADDIVGNYLVGENRLLLLDENGAEEKIRRMEDAVPCCEVGRVVGDNELLLLDENGGEQDIEMEDVVVQCGEMEEEIVVEVECEFCHSVKLERNKKIY